MATIGVDVDGTITSAPEQMGAMMMALKAAAHQVIILTGVSGISASQQDFDEKTQLLTSLGCGQCWDSMYIIPHAPGSDLPAMKADLCKQLGVDVLIDNDKNNAKACMAVVPLVLVPWASRVP